VKWNLCSALLRSSFSSSSVFGHTKSMSKGPSTIRSTNENDIRCGGCLFRWGDLCVCAALRGDVGRQATTAHSYRRAKPSMQRRYQERLQAMKPTPYAFAFVVASLVALCVLAGLLQ
jgi:hypothetical protein